MNSEKMNSDEKLRESGECGATASFIRAALAVYERDYDRFACCFDKPLQFTDWLFAEAICKGGAK